MCAELSDVHGLSVPLVMCRYNGIDDICPVAEHGFTFRIVAAAGATTTVSTPYEIS